MTKDKSVLPSAGDGLFLHVQLGVTCAAAAGRSGSPSGSRWFPCWVSVRGRCRGRPAEPGRSSQRGKEALQKTGASVLRVLHHTVNERACGGTFSFLCRVAAHSLNTVEAVGLDGAQTEHLGVLKNSTDLITDPVQSHHLTLHEPQRAKLK